MILQILFIMTMFLWFLTSFPHPVLTPFAPASQWLAFIAVLLLGLFLFAPALRG
jgi:hypothetical protein